MAKDKQNGTVEVVETSETALAQVGAQVALDTPESFLPNTREQLEIVADLQALRKSIDDLNEQFTKPSDLADAGVVFDIYDAYLTTFNEDGVDKTKVMFELVEQGTGVAHKVMQSDDTAGIRRKYATLFSYSRAMGIATEPLVGYQFIYSDKVKAGNRAIILTRANARIASA